MTAVHRNVHTHTGTLTHTCIHMYIYMYLFVHTSEHSGTRQYNCSSNSSLRPTAISYAHAHLSYICLLLPSPPILLNLLASFRLHFSCIVSILQCVTRFCCAWCLCCCCICLSLCRCLGTLRLPPGAQNLGHSTICWPNRTIALVSHSSCFHLPLCLSLYSSFSLCAFKPHTHMCSCVLSLFSLAQAVAFISRFPTLFLINAGRCDCACVCVRSLYAWFTV